MTPFADEAPRGRNAYAVRSHLFPILQRGQNRDRPVQITSAATGDFAHPTFASWVIYPPIIPVERIPAQHLLGAVEQRPDIAAGRLVGEFLDAILSRNGRVLHDVEPGIDLEDLVGARVARVEELYFGGRVAARGAALVCHVRLQALAI